jgi:uncharacterized protein (DUF2336 family)
MIPAAQPLLAELDAVLDLAADSWRSTALRKLTDLFLASAPAYTPDQVAVFDEVMTRLMEKIDRRVLAELSNKLAPVDNAPGKVVGKLARHYDSQVAEPVLRTSKTVCDKDLASAVEAAQKNMALLSIIADRPRLAQEVTNALIQYGNLMIARKVLDNVGSEISELGFAKLVSGAERSKELAIAISKRADLPAELLPWITAALERFGVQKSAESGG